MNDNLCNAEHIDTGLRCVKAPHGDDENHWAIKPDGMDLVWMSVTLRPPRQREGE